MPTMLTEINPKTDLDGLGGIIKGFNEIWQN